MIAIRNDISIEQGATFLMTLFFRHADGTPVDLNGYTGRMQVREHEGARVLADISEGVGITTTAAEGKVEVRISPTITSTMAFRTVEFGKYDLFVRNTATGDALRLAEGNVELIPAITR